MEALNTIVARLDAFFAIAESGADPAFARFLPTAYESESLQWREWVEPAFAIQFNGLMIRGGATVHSAFLAAFPSDAVLQRFLASASPGDLLFVHHPIDLESGDPQGSWGRFFRPIPTDLVRELQRKHLSIYSCHAPLDYHASLSTSRSIATALGGKISGEFFPYGLGHAGIFAKIPPIATSDLEKVLLRLFGVRYLDTAGARPRAIQMLAIVAGAGDRVEQMSIAEAAGAQAYLTGEIHSRIDTDYGRAKFTEVERFAAGSSMALLGVSHAASEFLVMQNEMRAWFRERSTVEAVLLPEEHWWR